MKQQPKRQPDLESDLEAVLYYLCAEWGYCDTKLTAADFMESVVSAHAFADKIMIAEGLDPECEVKQRRSLIGFFRERYGESISAETYSA